MTIISGINLIFYLKLINYKIVIEAQKKLINETESHLKDLISQYNQKEQIVMPKFSEEQKKEISNNINNFRKNAEEQKNEGVNNFKKILNSKKTFSSSDKIDRKFDNRGNSPIIVGKYIQFYIFKWDKIIENANSKDNNAEQILITVTYENEDNTIHLHAWNNEIFSLQKDEAPEFATKALEFAWILIPENKIA